MGGSYQVEILSPLIPKGNTNFRKLIRTHHPPHPASILSRPADLIVLTKGTVQGTTADEDGTAASTAGKRRLFPEVKTGFSQPQLTGFPAEPPLPGQTVHPAVMRTEIARRVIILRIHRK